MKNCKLKREITLTVKNQKNLIFFIEWAILVKFSHDSPKKESNKQKIITTRASIKRTAANRVMIKPHDQSEDTMCSLLMIIFATCIKTINIIICSLSQMSRS